MNKKCPICKSSHVSDFLSHNNVPVHQNFLVEEKESSINMIKGNLNLGTCEECGFVFNQTFDPSKLKYGIKYDNTQDYSSFFTEHVSNLIDYLINDKKIKNCKIIEIGCGKGVFLREIIKHEMSNFGIGFDPSYVGPNLDMDGHIRFEKKFYDESCSDTDADVIICRHVIEHIADPISFLKTIKKSLKNSNVKLFFETPSVEWVLRNNTIWDFFYEHCSYFTKNSLRTAFESVGFNVEEIKSIFGDQYIWLEASISSKKKRITKNAGHIPKLAKKFTINENHIREKWKERINELTAQGKVALWGAGAKGVTFSNIIDPKNILIDSVIDLNPKKCGKYIPGTGHEIINYKDIPQRGIKTIILMNPNYFNEISDLVKKSKLNVKIIYEQY